ncbi:MAG TPA: sodium:proton antiporter [Clostridiales bacterium]|nr:sodium:proton antiporter [Clostridiales bacterium]
MAKSVMELILQLAAILLLSKLFGLFMRKLGLPEVVGSVFAGLILGNAIWGLFLPETNFIFPIKESDNLALFSKIGVLLILFKAGLETDVNQIKSLGIKALLVAMGGVLLPLGLGFLLGLAMLPNETWHAWLFIGTIMTATSVGITVETLKSLGKYNTKIGSIITSAAIIDDVLGMIVLTVVMSIEGGAEDQNAVLKLINPHAYPIITILWMFVFFIVAIAFGYLIVKFFNHINKVKPNVHRVPIYSLVICFLYAYVAEEVFGVADITGAYIGGAILSLCHNTAIYADKKLDVGSYTFFTPVFFAYIGIQISFQSFTANVIIISVLFVIIAILGKIVGCGGVALLTGENLKDSTRVGVGMIARGEVALAVTTTGISAGLIANEYISMTVLLVLVSSILAPILLKALYKGEEGHPPVAEAEGNYE